MKLINLNRFTRRIIFNKPMEQYLQFAGENFHKGFVLSNVAAWSAGIVTAISTDEPDSFAASMYLGFLIGITWPISVPALAIGVPIGFIVKSQKKDN